MNASAPVRTDRAAAPTAHGLAPTAPAATPAAQARAAGPSDHAAPTGPAATVHAAAATHRALAPTARALAWCLHALVVGLLALTAGRAVADGRPHAGPVVAVAAACGLAYAAGPLWPRIRRSRRAAAWWPAGVVAVWLVLLALTPDAVWVAFPLYFLQLHLLPRRVGIAAVAATAAAAAAGFAAHQHAFSVAMVIGPALGAAVAGAVVWGYEALYRESEQRRRLIEELTATRADLARAEHAAGVLAERERLAREIHDTLAQGLSSIQLLLRAAERALPDRPDAAARHVDAARHAAVDNLAEARRFVAALAPPALDGTTLAGALERLCTAPGADSPVTARLRLVGEPVALPTAHEVALLRIAQSALANTVRHARATTAEITLSYLGDGIALDVVDDGRGFAPDRLPAPDPESGGFGLAAMRARMHALGGTLTVESAPGRGTALGARLPLADSPAAVSQVAPGSEGAPGAVSEAGSETEAGSGTAPLSKAAPETEVVYAAGSEAAAAAGGMSAAGSETAPAAGPGTASEAGA